MTAPASNQSAPTSAIVPTDLVAGTDQAFFRNVQIARTCRTDLVAVMAPASFPNGRTGPIFPIDLVAEIDRTAQTDPTFPIVLIDQTLGTGLASVIALTAP